MSDNSSVTQESDAVTVTDGTTVLSARGITKHYGHVQALRGIDLDIRKGEIVGLVGDNGAGKSTLVGILSGALQPSAGTILMDGQPIQMESTLQARALGIETIYQDLALAPDLSAWANFFLGREITKDGWLGRLGWLDHPAMIAATEKALSETRIQIGSVRTRTGRLSGGQRQAVAVARAVSWGSRLILMDEPTAALGVEQQERVGELTKHAAAIGVPVLFISHNLPQVREICDRIVVVFQGRTVANLDPKLHSVEDTIRWITGAAVRDASYVN